MSAVQFDAQQQVGSLYRDHHGWLQGWLGRKLGNAFDAADLAQDTFLRILSAWQKAESADAPVDLDLRQPRAYLTTVAARLLVNHYRRLSLERAYLEALAILPDAQAPSTEDRLIILETLHQIDAMLGRLTAKVRTAFLLSQLEGLSYADIADRLQVHVRTVKRYMAEAYEECILLMA